MPGMDPMSQVAKTELVKLRILLVDSAPASGELVQLGLSQAAEFPCEVRWAGDLAEAFTHLRLEACFDVVLLNLTMLDRWGPGSLQLLRQCYRNLPVVMLTAAPDETSTSEPVKHTEQDTLVLGQISAQALLRSIRFAIQRQHYMAAANQYLSELEAFGSLAAAVEPEQSERELLRLANFAMLDVKKQLQVVVSTFVFLDLLCRDRFGAEGIHFCTPIAALTAATHDQRAAVRNSNRYDEQTAGSVRPRRAGSLSTANRLS